MFTNRVAELAKVHQLIADAERSGPPRVIVAIDGMAGVGKTALAIHIAEELVASYDKVLYQDLLGHTPGRMPASPRSLLVSLLVADGLVARDLPDDLEGLASLWRSRIGGARTLMVLDNALDEDQVEALLPGAPGFVVLVTSRQRLTRLRAKYGAVILALDCLREADGVTLFSRLADRAITPRDVRTVVALVRQCGGLPLAITLVASGLQPEPDRTFADQLAEFKSGDDPLSSVGGGGGSLATAFEMSYRRVNQDSRRTLRALSLTPGVDIDAYGAAALTGLPLADARSQLQNLYGHRLLERSRDRYRMHDLIRSHVRRSARDDPETDPAAIGRLIDFYRATTAQVDQIFSRQVRPAALPPPPRFIGRAFHDELQAVAWVRAELPNLLACAEYAAGESHHRWTISLAAAVPALLRNDGHWTLSADMQERAIAAARSLGNVLAEANSLSELALLLRLTGNERRAVGPLRRALDLYRASGSRLGEAHALNDLGVVLDQLAEPEAAREHLRLSLEVYRDLGDRLGEANVLHDQGVACRFAGDYAGAVELIGESLRGYRAVGNALGEAHALTYLAIAQRLTGELPAAIGNLQGARQLYSQLRNRLGEANTTSELATAWRLMGEFAMADEALVTSLALHRGLGNRRGEARAYSELGLVRSVTGDDWYARKWLRQALRLFREQQNPRGEVEVLNNLGTMCRRLGQLAAAGEFHEQALELARRIKSARDEANALVGLGRVDRAQGRTAEAIGRLRSASDILSGIGAAEAAEAADLLAEIEADRRASGEHPGKPP